MRLFGKNLVIALICAGLAMPVAEAQGRHNGARNSENTHQRNNGSRSNGASRPGSSNGNGNKPGVRPGANNNNGNNKPGVRPGTGTSPGSNTKPAVRPGNNHGNNSQPGVRPGTNNGNNNRPGVRPGANQGNNDRPTVNPGHNMKPSGPQHGHRPGASVTPPRPDYRPAPPVRPGAVAPRPPVMAPPHRPGRPVMVPWQRPVPPPAWRPGPRVPRLSTILGITFGTAIGMSLDYLYNNGYVVDGYNSDMVYLRNVTQLNYVWPDATLYYGNGGLAGSQFLYSTSWNDLARYNSVYRDLVNLYGAPVSFSRPQGGYLATWFGYDNGYITLEYNPRPVVGGGVRYFTTLSFGN